MEEPERSRVAKVRKPANASKPSPAGSEASRGNRIALAYRILERLYRLRASSEERQKSPDSEAVLLAKEYLEEHYGEKLSNVFYLSKNYLRERFTECLGVSPAEYLAHIRVAKVLALLATHTVTQKEAAYLCGFSGQSHMIAIVKKYRGNTPRRLIGK